MSVPDEVNLTVNGQSVQIGGHAPSLVISLREELNLTGTKIVCGAGSCGACVVLVDDVPMASCLLPPERLEGRAVTTVEGIAGDDLHPMQRAFVAHDGLQCGFCTPGFIVSAAAFHDAWRSENGTATPSRDDVAAALAGHLCRCGAYEGIYNAVIAACEGRHDQPIDASSGRPAAFDKVTGSAVFTADKKLDGMLHGVIVRSTEANAEVIDVDSDALLRMPGVFAYIPMEGGERVRYVGQPIGAVAATDRGTARRAAAEVVVTYKVLDSAVTMDAALDDDAPRILQRGWSVPGDFEGDPLPALRRGNLRGPVSVGSVRRVAARRAIAKARERSDPYLVSGRWETQSQAHTALEPHIAVAQWTSQHTLEVHVSTQSVSQLSQDLAKRYGLEEGSVRVLSEHVGGAFGAKQRATAETIAAIELSKASGRPVKVEFDRSEEIATGGHRPAARIDLDVLGTEAGNLEAVDLRVYTNGGAAAGSLSATLARLMYPGVPKSLLDYDVVTNGPPGTAFRGPGAPPMLFAVEQALDEYASRLGRDPIELRSDWNKRPARDSLYRWASALPVWTGREAARGVGRFRRGVGAAFASWWYVYDAAATVGVGIHAGRVVVRSGTQDMGNGTRALLRASVAEGMGVDLDLIDVLIGDSTMPPGPRSSGSRTSGSLVPATIAAARSLRDRVVEDAVDLLHMDGAEPSTGGIVHAGELIPWSEVLDRIPDREELSGRPSDSRWPITPFDATAGARLGRGLTEGGDIVEVEIDTKLGLIRPTRVSAGIVAGKIISPQTARSQVTGGVIQGLSYALYEHRRLDPSSGLTVTSDFDSHGLAGIGDMPEIDVEFIEEGFDHVLGGGVGLAELPTVAVAAATANAVAHATGWRPKQLPITPATVVGGISHD